ncbi:hypothetical protein COV93_09030 [Candidatus Woesearchaeota archaeon CG11_big_fil_rev_8_21_14_0_20_43_8]|nr:MAG: hypothetical protein COV93_09030 [Candidatus Woesearchaeota archaeon CG11_big_fil_rev_8_21_14_0_20_43_8]PIO05153.1 MAG: hypothetical protein COT47_06095 [Candidatus Woesearchaeota archaeon CG08_land_8_20_14_0_20_43_7]
MRHIKGQVQSQLFTYVLSVIIAGMLLLFGYKAIDKFTQDASFAEELKFESDLKKLFSRIDYRSEIVEELYLPKEYEGICFLSMKKLSDTFPSGNDEIEVGFTSTAGGSLCDDIKNKPIIKSSCDSESRKNVFLINKDTHLATTALDSGYSRIGSSLSGSDAADNVYVCFNAPNRKAKVKLFGCGKYGVLVTEPDQKIDRTDCDN